MEEKVSNRREKRVKEALDRKKYVQWSLNVLKDRITPKTSVEAII